MKVSNLKNELLMHRLRADGITCDYHHAAQFRKSAMRLQCWHESMCNDTWIDDDTGIAYRQYGSAYNRPMQTVKVPNIGKIEQDKIAKLCSMLDCHYYIQGDPRGASLYVSSSPINCNGNRGVCCDLD